MQKASIEAYEIYALLGGDTTAPQAFTELVDAFYEGVAEDPLLRPLYPEEDLTGARERLTLFLIQYFGGPATYAEQRGHPRLRMRHMPFRIGIAERDAWLRLMNVALDTVPALAQAGVVERMRTYFISAADFLRNIEERES